MWPTQSRVGPVKHLWLLPANVLPAAADVTAAVSTAAAVLALAANCTQACTSHQVEVVNNAQQAMWCATYQAGCGTILCWLLNAASCNEKQLRVLRSC